MEAKFRTSIPFLMHCVIAKVVGEATKEFLQLGFNVQGARVLIAALQNPGIRVGALADMTCIEGSTLSHMLRRMAAEGLLRRERVEQDNRSVSVVLTEKGCRIAEECQRASEAHERLLLAGISSEDEARFRQILKVMNENVERAIPGRRSAVLINERGNA